MGTQIVDKVNNFIIHSKKTVVIPAEAGIYEAVIYIHNKYIGRLWMPAFAGMTEDVSL